MTFTVQSTHPTKVEADAVVIFAAQSGKKVVLLPPGQDIDRALERLISDCMERSGFDGSEKAWLHLHTFKKIKPRIVVLSGVGTLQDLTIDCWQTLLASCARKVRDLGVSTVAITLPEGMISSLGGYMSAAKTSVEACILGTYAFEKYRSQKMKQKHHIRDVVFLAPLRSSEEVALGIRHGTIRSNAVVLARDLVNEPAFAATPSYLASVAQRIAKNSPNISCKVFNVGDMRKEGMGGILGIGQGSEEKPVLIRLSYKQKRAKKTVVLVGKGITYDSGGLSPSRSPEHAALIAEMKMDMAGAASLLGLFSVIEEIGLLVNVVGLIPAVENMPGGGAVRPGDIVRMANGKTVEINHTDAEGRVIIADAIAYASKNEKPDMIVDIATLTGACMVALGEEIGGIFSNNDLLLAKLLESAKESGEKLWHLPLASEYMELLKTPIADIRNYAGTRYGGSITGALFISEFVPQSIPWAHIDIAGPAIIEKDKPLTPVGGSGFIVRTLLTFLQRINE